ncbi:GDSL-like Lipase/Acylhydrolase [Aquisphaera giovannonii]|uniref:GDSL-like Lipase/Acylhydrolase n=1 Tax=Aquisphaera giovannonii TaxID=406548 RepID=A0A5B9WDQ8_9BACT|nr:GDSL-type esterase/lipase family protein [Aquisphaera giovannonii]QEH38712.1 GDSL-like Lipase/Acylhydrolase [Aquisphaera giovannonii]
MPDTPLASDRGRATHTPRGGRLPRGVLLMLAGAILSSACPCGASAGDFALRDGDTVVFLGDSITAARTYGRIVENYTLLRFPDRKVHFLNAGWGGDTAEGGLRRLDRDVLDRGATVLIVAYGVNDIGWGTHADEVHRRIYLDSIRGIVERAKARKVRVYICSAAATAESPDAAERGFLQTMCDDGMAIARELGEHAIDIQRGMRAIQRAVLKANERAKPEDRQSLHVADGVHLNDLGQLAMAFSILKGLDAPAEVSSVAIDVSADGPRAAEARGCKVNRVTGGPDRLEFDRLDDGLPLNFGLFGALNFRYVPIPEELNRYLLRVRGLPTGRYAIEADGRGLGTWTDAELARSVNLASATADGWQPGGPWDAQAWILQDMTQGRDKMASGRLFLDHYLPAHPDGVRLHALDSEINARIEDLQRALVKPRPFHFVIHPAPAEATKVSP